VRAHRGFLAARNGAPVERLVRRVRADWTVPPPPPAVFWNRESIESVAPQEVTYEWVGDSLRHVGTVVHAYLQRIAREGLTAWNASTIFANRDGYHAMLTYLGVPDSELRGNRERVEAGLLKALRDPRGQWVLGPQLEAECEYPITGLIDGKVYQAVIDRTFVDDADVRWIIDYKTSSHEGGDLETFLENEKLRYQDQLERYSRLMVQSENRPIRLALYFPLLNGWREWAAPTVKRRQASLFE
jgi:ATP-dependent helicase/nuclease subunit A